jgi:hypothetical protein
MAVPTVGACSPSVIYTGGQFVTLTGTNFRLPATPGPSTGPLPPPTPTVAVTIGGVAATSVAVYSTTQLSCIAAAHDEGAVSISVQNLNNAGAPISGELATAAGLLSYKRAALTDESDFTRLTRALLRELKRQIIDNVVLTVATDFDSTPGGSSFDITEFAQLPALVVQGPIAVDDDRPYDDVLRPISSTGPSTWERSRTPRTVDVSYRIFGLDDKMVRAHNLLALVLQFFHLNMTLKLDRDPADLSKGSVQYELISSGDFAFTSQPNASDVRSFAGTVIIRGFQIEAIAGFPTQMVRERGAQADDIAVPQPGVYSG